MTIKELFEYCKSQLDFCDSPDFEALCIFEDFFNISKSQIVINNIVANDEQINTVNSLIERRKKGEPLQYILGKWEFYDMSFYVGNGVLIPRPETEILVDFALEKIKDVESPIIYDLCAGTGCIGLTIAKHRKDAKVFLIEKEDKAIEYLEKNKAEYHLDNAVIIKGDIFELDLSTLIKANILLSNPPYIPMCEIEELQKEVHFEPITALDGGADGLDFYRCIADEWTSVIKKGGYLALECGDGQSEEIIDLFFGKYTEKQVIYDFNNIDRIVAFRI